ncbi:extracellular solute-binding protein [Paenibacillus mesophilus]|uniref:extracellular solute-binding protein n=1 Tax=Paenibacillus mesophilus TaxID=2582849 RepID=UPI00110EAF93|nr:extracellular solute-binding protein [Paenibacillus mesophilus]TMV47397.1 extracellular solute-binding protein [Paenibacillus mesophilus]
MRRNGPIAGAAIVSAMALMIGGCEKEAGGAIAGSHPASGDKPVLRVATNDNYYTANSYTDDLPVWREVEKRTGVKIVWEVLPRGQFGDAMRLRLSKGTDLPDIFYIPESDPVRLAGNGTILPLDELISKQAPNIAAFLRDNPDIDKKLRLSDGKLYALASVVTGVAYTDPYGLMIRKDWLDRLGLREPTTLDEWYTVLKAFKENDPNGNGLPDEIPLLPDLGLKGLKLFGSAVRKHLFYSDGFYPDASGKVKYEWLSEETKQLVEWWRKLYGEGLLAPDFLTKTTDSFLSEVAGGRVGALNGFLNQRPKYESGNRQAGDPQAEWVMTVPPGGAGHGGFYEIYGPVSSWFGISASSPNPELAIRWLDYIYASEEGSRLVNFGVEGLTFTMSDGKPKFTDYAARNPDGLDLTRLLRSLGAMPTLPWIRADKGPLSHQPQAMLDSDPVGAEMARKVRPYLVESLPLTLPTPEEKETDELYGTPLRAYVESTLARYITGAEAIDWDRFGRAVASLGLDRVLQARQRQYDRYKGAPSP